MKKINLAVVGATGMVGRTFLKVLEERQLPIENFYVMASARSAGSTLKFNGKDYVVEELNEHSFDKPIDIALIRMAFMRQFWSAKWRRHKRKIRTHRSRSWLHRHRQQLPVENGSRGSPDCSRGKP